MNPFTTTVSYKNHYFVDWKKLASKPYNKNTVDPYTKLRIILMNGTEFESVWFYHSFLRHCGDNDLRRELALINREEQQQQKRIASLKPMNESILEHTIGYEHLAVDLTAALAKREKNKYVKQALNFALLEDFDHLYRFADLLEMETNIKAERLIGRYTEIMPGRPTIAEHRFPYDDVRNHIDGKTADPVTKLNIDIITAAEQQTMNFYMNVANLYDGELGRKLFAEIGMIEEQHVTHYGSLKCPKTTWLEGLVMKEYTEAYLYYSCYKTETDERIKALWEELFEQEVGHLYRAAQLLKKYEKKSWQKVIPNGEFPQLLRLGPNKEYIRSVLNRTVTLTGEYENYADIDNLSPKSNFFKYQGLVNPNVREVATHDVIKKYISKKGRDYRYQDQPHPIKELADRKTDNTEVGRAPMN